MRSLTSRLCGVLLVLFAFHIGAMSAAAKERPEGKFTIVFPAMWNEALDPILSAGVGSIGLTAIYDDIVGAKVDGSGLSAERGLADHWEMTPDGRVWTIRIRKGVQFHRGFGEVTADDIKFTIERASEERSVAQRKSYFKKRISKVEIVDRYTVKVHAAKAPIPDFITYVSPLQGSTERFVVSKKAFEKLGPDGFASNPVGSGAFRFTEHVGGQYIRLKAVSDHWRINPRFDTVTFRAVPEEETSVAMLARGSADVIQISRSNIKRLRDRGMNVVVQDGATAITVFLDDLFVESVPVNKEKVREALNLAVDRQLIVDTIFEGQGRPIGTYYTQTHVLDSIGYDWKPDLYPYDPDKAKRLLAEAGYPNGFDLDVYLYPWSGVPEAPEMMQAVAGMWQAIGIRPHIKQTEYGVVRANLLKGKFPGAVGYFPGPNRPWQGMIGVYRIFMHSEGAFAHVKFPELDRLLDAASNAIDPDVAKANLRKAARFIRKHHLSVPLLQFDQAFGVSDKAKHWDPGFLPQNLNFDSMLGR